MMRILVTGAAGFLGRLVCAEARAGGDDVLATARDAAGAIARLDVGDPAAVLTLLAQESPDVVVNCAGVVDFNAPLSALYGTNTLAPAVLAMWCAKEGRHLVQCSTIGVYGARTTSVAATSPINADTAYARSKLLADEMIEASGASASVVRLGGLYGANGPAHLGFNRAIADGMAGKPPTLSGSGDGRRSYLWVEDAARALLWCARERVRGTFIAAGAETLTVREMLTLVRDQFAPGASIVETPGEPTHDQIVHRSEALPPPRAMQDVVRELHARRAAV